MRIVHIAPNAPYNDYWGYQDNLLPKYHKKLGHDVTVLTTNTIHKDGKIVETDCADYVLNDGVRVIRLNKKKYFHRTLTALNSRLLIYDLLKDLNPDFVFFHGLVSTTILDVIDYKKKINPNCIIVQDNHLDYYNNSGLQKDIKSKIIKLFSCCFFRYTNRKVAPYISKVYGVTPWRKDYAENYFKVPKTKTDVLIMGADDEHIDFENQEVIRNTIRRKFGIGSDDFLIVTGGKIDKDKKIHFLMQACKTIDKVKLLVFGNVKDDFKEEFDNIVAESKNIIYIGWIASNEVYDYFLSADLVCFPGTHSVMWEQACACKVPCLFEHWDGMEHVNNGGNSDFVFPVTQELLKKKIEELKFTDKYFEMKKIAKSDKTNIYLYSKIAEKSLECAQ
ncbi:MAG: glycosyltransferase [Clostridia bacterium]|nr:glycosyltransferase [Clostridia bacterium]